MKLLINCPINALSFGNVSVNILKALHRKNVDICFFPIGDKTQLEAFDKTEKDFIEYLKKASSRRFHKITKGSSYFKNLAYSWQ